MPYKRSSVNSNGYSPEGEGIHEREESPTYLVEHLATFTVSKETGIVYPADGMRRLLQLEKTNGIWSQKMQLRLDKNLVLIIDNETGDVMEKFPAALIQEPTAFTSHDPIEIYNNILVFIVGDDRPNSHSEMHIFQCQMISAQELVEDLKHLRLGKPLGSRSGGHIPPPPPTPPPDPPLNGVSVREQVSVFNAVSQCDNRVSGGGPEVIASVHDDEASSTSSEKYGRDVTTLNHCFDDIEKFIARLQHSAAASRELERRKKNRKSKKKDMGDGLLTMRAKPPPELEFIDIFQKFKLSFILLAKLKHHIHDPNAPELVHFLFTPLALIVDASHDTKYAANLPAKVITPLLTQEAINLLINCVTSKETELWHSLGDPWLIPREQWKGKVAPYRPVFMDGWSPDYSVTDDIGDERRELSLNPSLVNASPQPAAKQRSDELRGNHHEGEEHYGRERGESHYSSDYLEYEIQVPSPTEPRGYTYDRAYRPDRYSRDERIESASPGESEAGPPAPARSDISVDSIERSGLAVGGNGTAAFGGEKWERGQTRWLEELRATGAKIVQVTYPRTANNDKELSVIRGEYLQVLDDSRKWWKARNSRGEVAHVPHTIVTPYQPDSTDVFNSQVYSRGYYSAQDERERSAASGRGNVGPGGLIPVPPPAPSSLVQPAPAPADWVRKERLGKMGEFRYF
uniref:Putative epidermal growth factor receptor kinase substrate n=1 Tax=Rhodnius neglectus TaxID=72488 RepID=A0A0P4VUF5_9HEMI